MSTTPIVLVTGLTRNVRESHLTEIFGELLLHKYTNSPPTTSLTSFPSYTYYLPLLMPQVSMAQ